MVEPIRELFNVNRMPNSHALHALALSFESILASTRTEDPPQEVVDTIHETFRKLSAAASVQVVLAAMASFLVDSTRAIIMQTEQPPAQ